MLDAGKYGEIQAFIPRDFSLHFLVVPEGQYDKGGWTMEEFLSYCREESRLAGTKLGMAYSTYPLVNQRISASYLSG